MIAHLKPYPAYKDSGVPWLGDAPQHWEVRRGKWLFRHRKLLNSDRADSNVLSLTLRGVVNNDPDNPEGLVPKDYATYQLFRKGDLVFKLIDLENLRTSRVGLVHEDGIMSSAYVRLTPQKVVDIRFFFQQYFDLYQRGIYNQLGAGVRSTLGPTDLLDLSVVVPPLPEQTAIVRFLDHMDRRIRKYIGAKQKLIKLLEEQKQAIIHRAVTRGLDPNVRLKPSGIEWLGDVPEHWEVRRLRYLIEGKLTYGANAAAEYTNPDWPRYLRITDFGTDGTLRNNSFRSLPPEIAKDYLVQAGDILLARSGATVGKAFLVTTGAGEACHAGYLIRARPRREVIVPEFLFAFTQSTGFIGWKDSTFIIATIQNIGAGKYAGLPVPLPPIREQSAIVRFLQKDTDTILAAIDRAQREISLLREYRTRLIADVVTGKLDVREAAAKLPEEVEEPTSLEDMDAVEDEDTIDEVETEPTIDKEDS